MFDKVWIDCKWRMKKKRVNHPSETAVFLPFVANAIDATKTFQPARFRRTLLYFTDDDEHDVDTANRTSRD